MTNAFNYKQNVFYISNFGVNLLAFYYEWPLYSLSIKQLDYELAVPKTRSAECGVRSAESIFFLITKEIKKIEIKEFKSKLKE